MGRTCLADRNRPEIIHFIISTRIKLRGRLRKGHLGQVCLTPQHWPEIIKVMLGIRAKHPRGLGAAREKVGKGTLGATSGVAPTALL